MLPLFRQVSWFDRVHRHGPRGGVRSGGPGVRLSSCPARRQRLRDCPALDAEQSGLEGARLSDFRSHRCAVHTESSLSPHPSGLAGVRRRVAVPAARAFRRSAHFTKSARCAAHCRRPRACVHCPRQCTFGWWWLTLLAMTPVMAWVVFQTVVYRSGTVARTLETFAADFIREFERPLIDERTHQSALHSEISVSPRMRSMEVRLAPAGGRRYPNLEDHRSNVEYDIHRVLTLLDDRRFSCGPIRSHGPWIAFPFRLTDS